MKKSLFTAAALSLILLSCSEDDAIETNPLPGDPGGGTNAQAEFVLNEIEYLGDRVEILNNGQGAGDIGNHFLCLGPGQYAQISSLTFEGNLNLGPGEFLTVFYEMPQETGGIGLYANNSFTDSGSIVDFVQWGAAGSARENVAVQAGLWTTGDFVAVTGNPENTIIFDGDGNGVANWSETGTPTLGSANTLTMPEANRQSVVLNEVQFGNLNRIEILNNGNVATDISNFWLCLGPGQYAQIGNLEAVSGSAELGAGDFLVVSYDLPDEAGGLGLYSNNSFTDPEAIVDFVQWGGSGSARENVAVEAGIWTSGDFVPGVGPSASIEYDGEGDMASDWSSEAIPSLGEPNDADARTTVFNVTITNMINYLNAHVFNTPVGSSAPGPLTQEGQQYSIQFNAVPGTYLSFVTMMGNSNDWFLAPENPQGIALWENGMPLNGVDVSDRLVLFDAGTEADNDPNTFPPAGANVGPADPNPIVRLVDRGGNRGDFYLSAILDYQAGSSDTPGTFTLTITKKATDFVVTPGLAVLHALSNPFFTEGEMDRGVGLEAIAEDGNPMPLYNWFKETGSQGAPLRLASSLSVFSPGIVYAFNSESDPLVLQGQQNNPENGLEQIAEDGNNSVAVSYLQNMGIPVAASNESSPVGPGNSLTFSLEVPQNQEFKFGFSTMLVQTNDWFISYNNAGYPLFDENGNPVSGYGASEKSYLYDSGTEVDETVGFGMYQAPRQSGPDVGPADANNIVRRVSELEDIQFGKGLISSGPGVVYLRDPRGGYNLIRVEIQPQ